MKVLLHVCFYAVDLETNEFVQNAGEKKFVSMAISFNRDGDVECSMDGDKVICKCITENQN